MKDSVKKMLDYTAESPTISAMSSRATLSASLTSVFARSFTWYFN